MLTDILGLSETQFVVFFLGLVRISALISVAPFFGNQTVPNRIKIFLSLFLTILILPIVKEEVDLEVMTMAAFFPLTIKEVVIGLFLGFNAKFFFESFQFAGRLITTQMGLSMAEIIDPESGAQSSIIGSFYGLIALVLFLVLNGHHLVLSALYRSFEIAPVASSSLAPVAQTKMLTLFNDLFIIGLKLAAPAMVTLFLMEVSMGIMARIVPQMNIFFVGLPLKLGVGMMIIVVSLPVFYVFFESILSIWRKDLVEILRYF